MAFEPPRCPYPACSAHVAGRSFRWRRRGRYRRRCDGRSVQRFECLECERRFSAQSFRLDFGLRKPHIDADVFGRLISKSTLRQIARVIGVKRATVERRLDLFGRHCRAFHGARLAAAARRGGVGGRYQLDELETFETDRHLQPVTVPVLIEASTYFVVHVASAALPCRGNLNERKRARRAERERRHGRRLSGSRRAVERSLLALRELSPSGRPLRLASDCKSSYASLARRLFAGRLLHERVSSKEPRKPGSVLFPINHALACARDELSRLVRRSWGVSKDRRRLETHLWIWVAWRNYVRGVTNKAPRVTPAMALGVCDTQLRPADLLRWRLDF